jgi:hypothetical protein
LTTVASVVIITVLHGWLNLDIGADLRFRIGFLPVT